MKPIHWVVIAVAVLALIAYFVIPKKAIKANHEADIKKAIAEAQKASSMEELIKIGTAYLANPLYPSLEAVLYEQIYKIPTNLPGENPHPMALSGETTNRALQIRRLTNPLAH